MATNNIASKKIGITRFLGTNCDRDIWRAVEELGYTPEWLWYEDSFNTDTYKAIMVPGGFSYGDYLRCGALAAKSNVMKSVGEAAQKGIPVMGICNGFQILCETKLLPGVLLRNEGQNFIDKWVTLKTKTQSNRWALKQEVSIPIAHGEGRYYVPQDDLKKIQDNDQIWVTYNDNPNGSVEDIAGVLNKEKNVGALMPHPERAMKDWMGSADGKLMLTQFLEG